MRLVIISHTEHYKKEDGVIVGWGPTVNEINHLLEIFDEIVHVAMLHSMEPPPSALPYQSDKILFVPIPVTGGSGFFDKLSIFWHAPQVLKTVSKVLKNCDYFQLRTPTGIGVYLIPYLTFFTKKKGWFKYAGNWNQKNPPLGYFLQRWMLKHQSRKVTINGSWDNQPAHCLTFENPCLAKHDIEEGTAVSNQKSWKPPFSFCFVGRLEREKGVASIIEAFTSLDSNLKAFVDKVHMVGGGTGLDVFKAMADTSGVNFIFHQYLAREDVFEVYKKAHVFLMPTKASEGFPKVIAEALNFGCFPIVSNISSIGQYVINGKNGILLQSANFKEVEAVLKSVINMKIEIEEIDNTELINKFSYPYYNQRILNDIL